MRIGFVGLGDQGQPIARRIVQAGFPTTVWARRAGQTDELGDEGADVVDQLGEVGARSDVVGVCVFGPSDVRDVLFGAGGIVPSMKPGGVVMVHSTISPSDARNFAALAQKYDVAFVDAPVSGGRPAAQAGELVLMLGGDEAAIERIRPVAEAYANRIFVFGTVGSAQAAKLINNALLTAHMAIADEALGYARTLGIEVGSFSAMAGQGSGRSFGLELVFGSNGLENMGWFTGTAPLAKDVNSLDTVLHQLDADHHSGLMSAAHAAIKKLTRSTDAQ